VAAVVDVRCGDRSVAETHTQLINRRQPAFRARAVDRLGAALDAPAARRGDGFVGDVRATGRSAAKLFFNTSIKLMTFWADGVVGTAFLGSSARFSLSFEIKTAR
jgi:hypothetical protein